MSALSLRQQLAKIGEPARLPLAIPSGFQLAHRSLKKMMRAMEPPRIDEWTAGKSVARSNRDWTDEAQGMLSDGQSIFVVSSDPGHHAVYRLGFDFAVTGIIDLPSGLGAAVGEESLLDFHIGAPGFLNGRLFVPLQITVKELVAIELAGLGYPVPTSPPKVWIIDTATLQTIDVRDLTLPADIGYFFFGWCALNPWNGRLLAAEGTVSSIQVFDPSKNFVREQPLDLKQGVFGFQGGVVSDNAHLFVTACPKDDGVFEVLAYTLLNGAFLGRCAISTDDEVEGIALFSVEVGATTHVQVLILQNDIEDDIELRGFIVPDPSVL